MDDYYSFHTFITCQICGQLRPVSEYALVTDDTGKPHRRKVCNRCVGRDQGADDGSFDGRQIIPRLLPETELQKEQRTKKAFMRKANEEGLVRVEDSLESQQDPTLLDLPKRRSSFLKNLKKKATIFSSRGHAMASKSATSKSGKGKHSKHSKAEKKSKPSHTDVHHPKVAQKGLFHTDSKSGHAAQHVHFEAPHEKKSLSGEVKKNPVKKSQSKRFMPLTSMKYVVTDQNITHLNEQANFKFSNLSNQPPEKGNSNDAPKPKAR